MNQKMLTISAFLFCKLLTAQEPKQNAKLLFSDSFSGKSLSKEWVIETSPKDAAGCMLADGKLQLATEGGVTVWYRNKLSGNVRIEYDRTVLMQGGASDRLSDLNQFWMATDPQQKMFTRTGGFREYDSLQMYYVGMGGNYNTTTRMRRYDGRGELKIVGEYKDSLHLLQPNKTYRIVIVVKNGTTTFSVDGNEYFSFTDDNPLREGWFALRSTKSRQLIDNVKIWQLD